MKKTLLAILLALSSAVHADAPFCPVLEFAELQTYTEKELMTMWSENFDKILAVGINRPAEVENCTAQNTRILRIVRAKKDAQVTPPVK